MSRGRRAANRRSCRRPRRLRRRRGRRHVQLGQRDLFALLGLAPRRFLLLAAPAVGALALFLDAAHRALFFLLAARLLVRLALRLELAALLLEALRLFARPALGFLARLALLLALAAQLLLFAARLLLGFLAHALGFGAHALGFLARSARFLFGLRLRLGGRLGGRGLRG